MKFYYFFIFLQLCSCSPTTNTGKKDTPDTTYKNLHQRILISGLTLPWEILWGPDNYIWMTERGGQLSRVNPKTGDLTKVYLIPDVESMGEGGLLGMALHPQFNDTPFVYVVYNYKSNDGYKEKVVRFLYNGNTLKEPIVLLNNINASSIHNGSRLLIDNNKLFISTGDASHQPDAQNKNTLNGKILRINLDGSIPDDNPIRNNPIWSWGHRNPQGLMMVGHQLFSAEHGPESDDEINIIQKGKNYGWPNVKGFCNEEAEIAFCKTNDVVEPIKTWTPTAAVSGADYYKENLLPEWRNSLLVVSLKNSRLYQLKLNDAHTAITETGEYFTNEYGRLRDVCISPEGKVYLCTSNGSNDKIIEISRE